METAPDTASDRNDSTMIGPNSFEIWAVPRRCTKNSIASTPSVIGSTTFANPGSISSRPSTALNTETAGVIMLSQKNRAVPEREQRQHAAFALVVRTHDDDDVLDRHRQDERPEDEREQPENARRIVRARCFHRFLEGVQRARADIAVDDTRRADDGGKADLP